MNKTVDPRFSLDRRTFVAGMAAAAGGLALARPALAQGVSGDVTFATFEWTMANTGSVLRKVSESFVAANPDVTIREVPLPAAGYHDQILTQLTAGTPPDIFRIDDAQLPLYIERGYLEPLGPHLEAAGIDPSTFVAAGQDARRDGETFAICYQTNARQLVYNKALLANVGIDSPPIDAAQFEDFAKRATDSSRRVFGSTFASKSGDVTGLFISAGPILLGMGSHFTTPEGKPNATDPNIVKAVTLLKSLWDSNSVPRGIDVVASSKLVYDGMVALSLNGSFVFGAATPEVREQLDARPSPLPGSQIVRVSSWYGIAANSPNKEAAIAWLIHMLSEESQATIVDIERVVPARPELIPERIYTESPWFQSYVDGAIRGMSYLPPGLGSRGLDQVRLIGNTIETILYRGVEVEPAMAELQAAMEAEAAA